MQVSSFPQEKMQAFPNQPQHRGFFHTPRFNSTFQKGNNYFNPHPYKQHGGQHAPPTQNIEFDGKRLRKAVVRKTIDYNSAIINQLQARVWQRDFRDQRALQPDCSYYPELVPPMHLPHNSINSVTTKFVRTSTNKMRCPIFCVAWTPEGRRLVTGASSGEFTLWNGLTFNFETILQAHDSPVRCMVWSHNDTWMVTGDHSGYVKYWQSNMNNVKMFQAHKEPLRGISFCPTDQKFATCSDDGTVRVWDFLRCNEEKILRGHGADVKCVDWHPQKSLIVSGSKDSQQPIKLWDPKNGQSLATLHAHKNTVMEVRWNQNGNWMLTASRDHLIKLFDIRNLSQEVQTFRGHKKEVSSLAWHPIHESLFCSGGSDGSVMFWVVGADKEVGAMEQAHDSIVWSLAWHPLGHILCSGSNDHSSKFWTRNRPGDKMRDKYNLNIATGGANLDDVPEYDEPSSNYVIPGMGLEQNASEHMHHNEQEEDIEMEAPVIPGLDFGSDSQGGLLSDKPTAQKKVPYAKPIPRQFQQQWLENKRPLLAAPPKDVVSPPGEGAAPTEQMTAPDASSAHFGGGRMPTSRPDRPDGPGNRDMPFGNDFRNRSGPKEGFQDVDQRDMFFRDQFHQMDQREFGDSDLRIQGGNDMRHFGDRGNNFPQRHEEINDPRLRLRGDSYHDYDSRDFPSGSRGGRSSSRTTRIDYNDSDLRIRDDADKNNSEINYQSRKRNWEDGDQRSYYGGPSRDNMYPEGAYGDAPVGRMRPRGRSNFRGNSGRARSGRTGYQ